MAAQTAQPLPQLNTGQLPDTYRLYSCEDCGLWFKHPRPDSASLAAHYAALRPEGSPWNYQERLPHELRIDRLLERVPRGAAVLDVGCWTGRLLAPHAKRVRAFGIEPNAEAAAAARMASIVVIGSTIDSLDPQQTFDAITMVDVFEHLPDPITVLRRLVSALSPRGVLVIVSGRTDCVGARIAGASYWYFGCPDHVVFLNRRFAAALPTLIKGTRVDYRPVRHFRFEPRRFAFELSWLLAWRFLSPHSPFRQPPVHMIPGLSRVARLRAPVVCGMWRDHGLLQLRRT